MLAVSIANSQDTVILKCRGRIVAGDEVARLKSAALCHQEAKRLILDLEAVQTMDGAGMGLLAFLAGWTRVVGIQLKLVNPSRHVRELLELTNLDSVLDIGGSEEMPPMSHAVAASATTNDYSQTAHR
jgi:anti-anti-sigma factor